jgi:Holliday junction resolvasome RuvABC DNA-binding subunit
MDRQQMIDALAKLGFDTSVLTEAVTDEVLAEMLRTYEKQDAEYAAEHADKPTQPNEVEKLDDTMTREQMIEALVGMGFDPAELEGKSDDELKGMLEQESGEPGEGGAMEGQAPAEQFEEVADPAAPPVEDAPPTRDEMIEALVEVGYDRDELNTKTDQELSDLFSQELEAAVQQMSDEEEAAKEEQAKQQEEEQMAKMGEVARFSEMVNSFKTMQSELAQVRAQLAETSRQTEQLRNNTKRANIVKFCEAMREQGKIMPAQYGAVVARLMRANSTNIVRKFNESGKKVNLTELDLQMREIEQAPALFVFSEKMKQPLTKADTEKAKIEQHFESFSESYAKHGTTKEKMVKAYLIARAKNPRLTAEGFVNGSR